MKKFIFLFFLAPFAYALAQPTPSQPCQGPGSQVYKNGSTVISQFGSDVNDFFWLIEPSNPTPNSAEVIVYWHGRTNYGLSEAMEIFKEDSLFVDHLARKGYIVIYPLYQHDGDNVGGANARVPVAAGVVRLALDELQNPGHVPTRSIDPNEKLKLGAVGGSLGGGMALRVADAHAQYNLPAFDAICAFVPGRVNQLNNLDPEAYVLIVSAEEDDFNGPLAATNNHQLTWNTVLGLNQIDCDHKNYIMARSDNSGDSPLVADHTFGISGNDRCNQTELDGMDYYGSWKWATALFNCRWRNYHCKYCLGNDSKITDMGEFCNGRAVVSSTVLHNCP